MKHIQLLVLFIIFTSAARGQAPNWTNFKLFAGQSFDYASSIKVDSKDNYYITANSQNPLSIFLISDLPPVSCNFIQPVRNTIYNGILLRYDSALNLNLSITIENGDIGETVIDSSENIYVSGVFQYGASRDAFIKKYSASGILLWTKLVQSSTSGGNDDDVITSFDIYEDGSMIMCGFSYGNNVSIFEQVVAGPDNFITKFNSNGGVVWTKNFTSDLGSGADKVKFDKAGDVLVAGNERAGNLNDNVAIIAKLNNSTGDIIWKKQFPSSDIYTPSANAIGVFNNSYMFSGVFGGQIKIGDSTLGSSGGFDIFLLQSDTAGNIKWVKKAGSTGRDAISNLLTNESGVTFLTGQFSDGFQFNGTSYSSKGNTDVLIGAIDSMGNTLWMLTGGSSISGHNDDLLYNESGGGIAIDSKKQIQVVGTVIGPGNFGSLKYDAPEDIKQNGFWLTLGSKASDYTINYSCNTTSGSDTIFTINVNPNPFVHNLIISNSKNLSIDYNVGLYNSKGQQLDKKYFSNSSSIMVKEWNNLPSGIYFLRISTTNLSKTFKLLKQ